MRIGGLAGLALMWGAAAAAQPGPAPMAIESGREVSGSAATAGPGGLVGCYAVTAPRSVRLVVELIPAGFQGELRIVPGRSCESAVPPSRRVCQGGTPVTLSIPVAPGPYAVSIRRTAGAGGSFRLVAQHTPSSPAANAGFAPPPAPGSAGQVTGSGFAPPSGNAQSAQRQMMLDQLARGEVRTVGAEDLRRQAEAQARAAEQRAQKEQMAAAAPTPQVHIAGAFMQGFNQTMRHAEESARQVEATNRQIRAMVAEDEARRARERARVAGAQARNREQQRLAQQQALAAQQRMAEARRQQQAAVAQQQGFILSKATGGTTGQEISIGVRKEFARR